MISITSKERVSGVVAELAGKPVVLVVEDEVLVRIVQVDILREAGFRVTEAQDADEAFEMLRSRSEIVIVLTDVDMPGSLNGFEFSRLVKQGWPEVGVLVISGKTQPGPGDLPSGVEFHSEADPASGARGAYTGASARQWQSSPSGCSHAQIGGSLTPVNP